MAKLTKVNTSTTGATKGFINRVKGSVGKKRNKNPFTAAASATVKGFGR